MAVAEDVATQRMGCAGIIFLLNPSTMLLANSDERAMLRRADSCVPIRTSAAHMCIPDTPVSSIFKALALATTIPSVRARYRFHKGEKN